MLKMSKSKLLSKIVALVVLLALLMSLGTVTVTADGGNLTRLAGSNRYVTAEKIADELKDLKGISKFDAVVLASGESFPDALSGSYLTSVTGGPIILVNPKSTRQAYNYVKANVNKDASVYILGGPSAVPEALEDTLKQNGFVNVKRLGGSNRYETNLLILKEGDEIYKNNNNGRLPDSVLVCSGLGFADALSAGSTGKPILLVNGHVSASHMAYLKERGSSKYYVIGGSSSVNEATAASLKGLGTVKRIWGSDRYKTSIEVAKEFYGNKVEEIVVAYGGNFPDGLAACSVAQYKKAPILLASDGACATIYNYQVEAGVKKATVMGGESLFQENLIAVQGAGLNKGWNQIGSFYVYVGEDGKIVTSTFKDGDKTYTPSKGGVITAIQKLGFIWPVKGTITSYFGPRYDVPYWASTNHGGIDIAVKTGTPVRASMDGTVILPTGWYGSYGYAVVIQHDNGYITLYGHNSSIKVKRGDKVKQGDIVALSGSTGNSTGPHLHFEVRLNGVKMDPLKYLP